MKKLFICLSMFVLVLGLASVPVYASGITDTGGGDASTLGTDASASTEATTETTTSSTDFDKQVDNIIDNDFVPDVKAEDFFAKINHKLSDTMSFGQKAVALVLGMIFIVDLVVLAGAAISQRKEKIVPCTIGLLVVALAFVADIYVMDILGAFAHYMGS